MQNFTRYPDAYVKKILNGSLNAIGTWYIPNRKTWSVYHCNQKKNRARNKCSSLQQRYLFICLFIFVYKSMFVCVKDRTCLRIAIPAYCFNLFGSIFCVLFCLFFEKLIKGSKTTWQSMKKFPCTVWSVRKKKY